jgi:hypothetical protein
MVYLFISLEWQALWKCYVGKLLGPKSTIVGCIHATIVDRSFHVLRTAFASLSLCHSGAEAAGTAFRSGGAIWACDNVDDTASF